MGHSETGRIRKGEKNPITVSKIEPAIYRLVAQFLNKHATACHGKEGRTTSNSSGEQKDGSRYCLIRGFI
jgi:hypothetical protein